MGEISVYFKREVPLNPEELRRLIDLNKLDWQNKRDTNCYAYALGLDVNLPKAFEPGEIGNSKIDLRNFDSFAYEQLLANIYVDLEALGIDYRDIEPLDDIEENEWKIAIFTTRKYGEVIDFHFMREHKDGIWYHKNGAKIYNQTFNLIPIKNPKYAYVLGYTYEKCLSLKLK